MLAKFIIVDLNWHLRIVRLVNFIGRIWGRYRKWKIWSADSLSVRL